MKNLDSKKHSATAFEYDAGNISDNQYTERLDKDENQEVQDQYYNVTSVKDN